MAATLSRRLFLTGLGAAVAAPMVPAIARTADCTFVNVLDFGAVADGVANCDAAFDAAMAAAGVGGTVYLPAGRYVLSRLKMPNEVTIRGDGIGLSLVRLP